MAISLYQYLYDVYSTNHYNSIKKNRKQTYIQIDDQDDNDNITNFCNIFVQVKKRNVFEIELSGRMPITREIADLAEIYQGQIDLTESRISLVLNPRQIEVVKDLASLIRKSAPMGELVGNPQWDRISARTISSLNRFIRIIKEYISIKEIQLA